MFCNKTFWIPPGDPAIARLGMIEVWPGETLFRDQHEERLIQRVQAMVDDARISQRKLDKLVYDNLVCKGLRDVCYRDLRHAGQDLVEWLADPLRAAGVLVSKSTDVGDQPISSFHHDMTISDWIETAGAMLPVRVS